MTPASRSQSAGESPAPRIDAQRSLNPIEGREWPVAGDGRQADSPVERVQARTGRRDQDFASLAAAVFPGHAVIVCGGEAVAWLE